MRQKTLNVHVNGISSGKTRTSLSLKFDRADLPLADADELLCGASLELYVIPAKDVNGQQLAFEEKLGEKFPATCGRLSVSDAEISTSVHIADDQADLNALSRFKFKTCKITIKRTGNAAPEESEDPAQMTMEDAMPTAAAMGPPADFVDKELEKVAERGKRRGRPRKAAEPPADQPARPIQKKKKSEVTAAAATRIGFASGAHKLKIEATAGTGELYQWMLTGTPALMTAVTGGAVQTKSEREYREPEQAVRDGAMLVMKTARGEESVAEPSMKKILAELAADLDGFLKALAK